MNTTLLQDLSPFSKGFLSHIAQVETPELYGAILTCQIRLYSEKIFEHLKHFPHWESIKTLLDIGCGPGEIAENLSRHSLLENKSYTGIDIEKHFIDRAVAEKSRDNINFLLKNVYDFEESEFDALLLILSLQHLGDIDHIIPKLLQLVRKNGLILMFDAMPDRLSILNPEVPILVEMFNMMSYKKTSGKRNDRALLDLEERSSHFSLKVIEMEKLEIPISPLKKEDYIRANLLVSEIIKRVHAVHIDQTELLEQFIFWNTNGGTALNRVWGKLIVQKS